MIENDLNLEVRRVVLFCIVLLVKILLKIVGRIKDIKDIVRKLVY